MQPGITNKIIGFHKYSVAYTSTGHRRFNQPFNPTNYAPPYVQGDVVGVGYRPRTGTIFFTRNGKKLDDVVHGLKSPNFFPAVGANGPCTVHVNFGQAGFVFIEANVKKWGLAPTTGSLAPPPPYGSEQGDILLEAGRKDDQATVGTPQIHRLSFSQSFQSGSRGSVGQLPAPAHGHGRTRSGNFRVLPPRSPGPVTSPTDISLAHFIPTEEGGESSSSGHAGHAREESMVGLGMQDALNPPPEYSSPVRSEASSRRNSSDSDDTPLIRVLNRSRGSSAAAATSPAHPPIPSYNDAMREGAGQTLGNRSGMQRQYSRSRSHSAQ